MTKATITICDQANTVEDIMVTDWPLTAAGMDRIQAAIARACAPSAETKIELLREYVESIRGLVPPNVTADLKDILGD